MWLPLARPLLGTWLAAQACVLPGNGTGNPLVRRPVLNPLRYSSQRRVMEYFISHVFAKAPCPTRPHTVCAPFIRTPRKTSLLTNIRKSSDLFKSFCLFLSYGHRESRTEWSTLKSMPFNLVSAELLGFLQDPLQYPPEKGVRREGRAGILHLLSHWVS